jgi:hypothetical protein
METKLLTISSYNRILQFSCCRCVPVCGKVHSKGYGQTRSTSLVQSTEYKHVSFFGLEHLLFCHTFVCINQLASTSIVISDGCMIALMRGRKAILYLPF